MTGVFLQVRLDSVRLPRKALLTLEDHTVVEHAMQSLTHVDAAVHALVTDKESAPTLRRLAKGYGFETFVGPKFDVLGRYVAAARHFGVDTIVRATGDNPLVSGVLAEMILREHHATSADYSGYDGPPLGTGVEIVDTYALGVAHERAVSRYDREHVCPYLYAHPGEFAVHRIDAPPEFCLPDARVTLDTEADYALLRAIYADLYHGAPIEINDLLSWLRSHQFECRSSA